MNKNRLLSSLIAVMAVLAADAQNSAAPKLVVGILIDQLRSDYLQAFMPLYGEGGFKRLMAQGRQQHGGQHRPRPGQHRQDEQRRKARGDAEPSGLPHSKSG